jgi:hypothetical protein
MFRAGAGGVQPADRAAGAAQPRSEAGCRLILPYAARVRLLPVLACCALVTTTPARAQDKPAWRVEAVGDAVLFTGRIERRSVDEFLRALRDHPGIQRLVITSGGGQVAAALDMGEAIHVRQLDVEVPVACLSSCANYIFPAARHKRLGHRLAVGWHGNITHVLYTQLTGASNWSEDMMQGARELARREARFYPRIGVDGFVCWFAKIAPYNVDNYYTVSVRDMARFGIRDVEVLDAPAPPPDEDTPAMVTVDFDRLERERPAMPLEP